MRSPVLALALAVSLLGCADKKVETKPAVRAPLVDLTPATTLAAVRTAFNAHRGEARFLTLLSPT